MRIKHYIMAAVILGLSIALILPEGGAASESAGRIDCRDNRSCIINSMQGCIPAIYFSGEEGVVTQIIVEGESAGICRIEIRNLGTPVETDFTNTSMVCLIPLGESEISYESACTGSMADAYSGLGELTKIQLEQQEKYGGICLEREYSSQPPLEYYMIGPETLEGRELCHTIAHLGVSEFGTVRIDYYFNSEIDAAKISYSQNMPLGSVALRCSHPEVEIVEEGFVGFVHEPEYAEIGMHPACRYHYSLIPLGSPGLEIDVFVKENNSLSVALTSEMGNSYSWSFPDRIVI